MRLTAVGLGPGDPELITVKGLRALQAADCLFVPRSRDGEQSLALRIADLWIDHQRQQVVELELPMTRNQSLLTPAWRSAADQIAQSLAASANGRGVYLLLGDPLLYGTFTYIWAECAARHPAIDISVIPGITSFTATAAAAQLTLASTSERVAIIPADASTDLALLRTLSQQFETLVLMKVGPVLPQILDALEALHLLDTTLYAERVGMPEELLARDVRSMRGERRPYLSLLIVRRSYREDER